MNMRVTSDELANALSPILVIHDGIVSSVILEPKKASLPISRKFCNSASLKVDKLHL